MTIAAASGDGSGYRCHERACNRTGMCGNPSGSSGTAPSQACTPESASMCRRSATPTSEGTGTKGTPAIRQPVTASTVSAVGLARTATRSAPAMRSATDVAAPTRSTRLSTAPSILTASSMSVVVTAEGSRDASSTRAGYSPRVRPARPRSSSTWPGSPRRGRARPDGFPPAGEAVRHPGAGRRRAARARTE